jgi:hypothetical protein
MGQLDLAIPEKKGNTKFKKETLEKVIASYAPSKGILNDAAVITGVSSVTISKYWKKKGFI